MLIYRKGYPEAYTRGRKFQALLRVLHNLKSNITFTFHPRLIFVRYNYPSLTIFLLFIMFTMVTLHNRFTFSYLCFQLLFETTLLNVFMFSHMSRLRYIGKDTVWAII